MRIYPLLLTTKDGSLRKASKRAVFSILTMNPGSKSMKVAILATFPDPAKSDPEGRVGPPESVRIPEKPGKAGKGLFSGFLRVQGPLVRVSLR